MVGVPQGGVYPVWWVYLRVVYTREWWEVYLREVYPGGVPQGGVYPGMVGGVPQGGIPGW